MILLENIFFQDDYILQFRKKCIMERELINPDDGIFLIMDDLRIPCTDSHTELSWYVSEKTLLFSFC